MFRTKPTRTEKLKAQVVEVRDQGRRRRPPLQPNASRRPMRRRACAQLRWRA